MDQGLLAVYNTLRQETLAMIVFNDVLILFVPCLMLWLLIAHGTNKAAVRTAAVFGAFAPYLFARMDLLIHRLAPAIAAIERNLGICGWENCLKPQLAPINSLLVPLDILAAMPIVVLFGWALYTAVRQMLGDFHIERIFDDTGIVGYIVVHLLIFVYGIRWIWHVLQVTGQLMQTVSVR